MSIYQITKTDMVGYANAQSGQTIPEADVTFSSAKPASANEVIKYGKNSRCAITFSASSTLATGSALLWYDRLDLAIISKMVLVPRKAPPGAPIADVINDVRAMTGIRFDLTELESTTLVANSSGGGSTLLVKAKPDSLGWIGSVSIPFLDVDPIASAFKSNLLNLF